eukprot:4715161-Pleurochrysis_carterae.AAC.1
MEHSDVDEAWTRIFARVRSILWYEQKDRARAARRSSQVEGASGSVAACPCGSVAACPCGS